MYTYWSTTLCSSLIDQSSLTSSLIGPFYFYGFMIGHLSLTHSLVGSALFVSAPLPTLLLSLQSRTPASVNPHASALTLKLQRNFQATVDSRNY